MEKTEIPYVKAVRVSNFKLWRTKHNLKVKNQKLTIECINISIPDGLWSVRIPATFEIFAMIRDLYAMSQSDNDIDKAFANSHLPTFLNNIFFASSVGNGYFHSGLSLVAKVYTEPASLNDEKFREQVKNFCAAFSDWVEKNRQDAKEPTDAEMHQDELAEQAMKILEEDGQ